MNFENRMIRILVLLLFFLVSAKETIAQFTIRLEGSDLQRSFVRKESLPEFIVNYSGTQSRIIALKVQLRNDAELISSFRIQNFEVLPGANYLQSATAIPEYISPNGTFIIPGVYTLNVSVYTGEFSELITSMKSPYRINVGIIRTISPNGWSNNNLPVNFCFALLSDVSFQLAEVHVWENTNTQQEGVLDVEKPEYAVFTTNDFCTDYPVTAPPLLDGKQYQVQVQIKQDNQLIARSRITGFSRQEKPEVLLDDYRLLVNGLNTGQYLFGTVIRFAYDNRFNESQLQYTLRDVTDGKNIKKIPAQTLTSSRNYIDIDLSGVQGVKSGHTYLLSVKNANLENYNIQFDYSPVEK